MAFLLKVDLRAFDNIQEEVDYYDEQQKGLGKRFFKAVEEGFKTLKSNPFSQVRYDNVRCIPLKRFPFLIHFTIDENSKTVFVHAVLHTSLEPKNHWVKKN